MGTLWLKDIREGLDTRRIAEALPGGSAIRATDGHINRGGEFEQRPAFVDTFTLPAGTVGLAYTTASLYVFGSAISIANMPKGVLYQRLLHPLGTDINRILSFDLFAGKIYVVAEFKDGSIYHFYDGARVTDWIDGRARASFSVSGGSSTPAVAATSSFTITAGTAGEEFTSVSLNGIEIIGASVEHTGDNATTAFNLANAISGFVSFPDYTAAAVGNVVTITAAAAGTAPNGIVPALVTTGDIALSGLGPMVGGAETIASQLTDLKVGGVSVLDAPVDWDTDAATTAAAIAASINAFASAPDYTATSVGGQVNVLAAEPTAVLNGSALSFTTANGLLLTGTSALVLANGITLTSNTTFQAGTYAKTIRSKMNVTAGQYLNFSGILLPTGFNTTNTGAGFVDMSTEASGAEKLQAVAKYQKFIVVFAERVIQIWYVDPDPAQNAQQQVLNNTGTTSPRSVTQFGDNDVFYVDENGIRSVRARVSTTAASTTDIGVPIDTMVIEKLASLSSIERTKIIGLIEPSTGRFWLIFSDIIFVFSFFEGSKISAWSTYTPSVNGVAFPVDDAVPFKKRVYVRSGDTIYCFGGTGSAVVYDETSPELWLPYLDAGAPADKKQFRSIDVACEGEWIVSAGLEPNNQNASDKIATVNETTYNKDTIPFEAEATHVSLRFKGVGAGAKKISAAAIKFEGDE